MSEMTEAVEKTKKPANSAFKQQRLSAWQPILTAGTVLPTFFVIGILFIPVGIGLLVFSDNVMEYVVDYTHCIDVDSTSNETCAKRIDSGTIPSNEISCRCRESVSITEDLTGRVYIYYALTNFYQNHRRYVKSRDDKQLLGMVGTLENPVEPDNACGDFRKPESGVPAKDTKAVYYPCGAIANSMFLDTISLRKGGQEIKLLRDNIAWESDKHFKFQNPPWWKNATLNSKHPAWDVFQKPKAWTKKFYDEWKPAGVQSEDFIVWMRTAPLPNFRKLYRIVDHTAEGVKYGLPKGNYTLEIDYAFKVTAFQGTKSIIISTTSLLGGKNPFLGISYIVVGAICLVLGIVFLFIHINYGKSTWEMTNVDSRTPY